MKKSSILGFLIKSFLLLSFLIIGGYFLLTLIIIPKVVIPKICKQAESQLQQKLTIKNITINQKGLIHIIQPVLYGKDSKDIMLECKQIKIDPSYKTAFNSWRTTKNNPEISLDIFINDLKLNYSPVTLSGNITSDFNLKLDLKNKENIDWGGNIKLEEINVQGIPTLGSINAITGRIAVSNNSLVSYDIEGEINNEAAKLEVLINDFKNPELILQGELSPLKFNLDCKLDGEVLNIKELKAAYNKIHLNASGHIIDLKDNANAQISADINLELEDLKKLPLEIKNTLKNINPRGLVKTKIAIKGPLKNLPALSGNMNIICPKLSLLDYEISEINISSELKNSKAFINSLEAIFLESRIWADADANILSKNLPFNAQIKISNALAQNFKTKFLPNMDKDIGGVLNTAIQAQGTLLNLNSINIQANAQLTDLLFDKFTLDNPLNANIDLILKDLKNIIIKKLTINDSNTSLIVDGRINDIKQPNAELAANIITDLNALNTYKFLNIPDTFKTSGKPDLKIKVLGNLLDYQSLNLPFELNSSAISVNQFDLDSVNVKGEFKKMKLDISDLSVDLYKGKLSAKAFIDLTDMKNLIFNSTAKINDINLQTFSSKTKLIPEDFHGLLSSKIILSGNGLKPENLTADVKGAIDIKNGLINKIEIKKANASVEAKYNNTNIKIKQLKTTYKNIELDAQGEIKSVLNNPTVDLKATTKLDLADLNKLPIDLEKTLDALALSGIVNAQIMAAGPITQWQQMNINADVSSEAISIKNIQLNNINISGNLNNKLLDLTTNLNSYDGTLDLKANAEFLNDSFKYNGTAKVTKLNIGNLIDESKIIPQPHKGILSMDADFLGIGTSLETIEAGIDFNFEEAQISGLELLRSVGKLLGLNFLSDFEVNQAQGTLEVKNSNVHTENTNIIGPEASIIAKGDITLDQRLNMLIKLILSPASAAATSSQVLDKFFTLENEQYFTELDVKGTLTKPQPDLSKFMRDRLRSQVKKEVEKQIFKALDGLFR